MKIKKSIGFTLLEIIISMLILSMVTAGIFGLFVTSSKYIVEAGHRLQAINYARQVAENLKIYVTADTTTPIPPGANTALIAGTDKPYTDSGIATTPQNSITNTNIGVGVPTCTYTVQDLAGGLKSATITVTWNEQ